MRLVFVRIVLLLLALPALPTRGEGSTNIWGREIMRQMYDKEPMREIKIPDWLEEIPGVVYTLTQFDMWKEAADAGARIGEMSFVDTGFVNYKSRYLEKMNPNLKPGYIEKTIENHKKNGIRIIGSFGPRQQVEMAEKHPDWRSIHSNTTNIPPVDLQRAPSGPSLCLMGPWGDQLIEILAEILEKFPDVDAFGFDGIHHSGACYCQHCRAAYRQETGLEIPNKDLSKLEYRKYLLWVDRRMENYIERMQRRLKGVKKDVAIITWTTNAGRFGHFLSVPHEMPARMNLLFDGPDQEYWLDEMNRGNSIVPAFGAAYLWSVSNHRVAFNTPYMMSHGNPYGTDSFPKSEMFRRSMLTLTWGARPSPAPAFAGFKEAALETIREMKARSPWLTHKTSERWGALLMSDATRNFYGREAAKVEERYLANVFGYFRAILEEHMPFEIINDWNLNPEDLAKYKVLVMPNSACVSDPQAQAVRGFVERGGGLVATQDASLMNELGDSRKDYALADLFGANWAGPIQMGEGKKEELDSNFLSQLTPEYWAKRKSVFEAEFTKHAIFEGTRLKEFLGDRSVVFKGPATAAKKGGAEQIGSIWPRSKTDTKYPAALLNRFGAGKVAYLPAGFDSAYYLYSYPYQRIVLSQAVRQVAASEFGIKVTAPMCVQTTYYRQKKDGERLVVQLFNEINSTAGHAFPNDDVPLPEEVIPVHGIKVRFADYDISRVHLEPGGMELKGARKGKALEVEIPPLDTHRMVVAELRKN